MGKKTITMYGSCVASNIFSLARDQNILEYTLTNRFFQINPISLMQSDPLDFLSQFEPQGRFNTAIASIKNDIHKNVFSILEEKRTEYLVIEQVSLYYNLLRIDYNSKQYFLTWMCEIANFNGSRIFSLLDSIGATYHVMHPQEYYGLIEASIKSFCDKLSEIFKPGQIIFVETPPAKLCVRKGGLLDCVNKENIDKDIDYLAYVSKLFLECVEGCHVIPSLQPMISSWKNTFGISPVHYDECYYEYAYKAIVAVTEGVKENEKIEKLQFQYSQKMSEIKDDATDKLLHIYRKQRIENSYDHYRRVVIDEKKTGFLSSMFDGGGVNLNKYIRGILTENHSLVLMFSVCDTAARYWDLFTERNVIGLRDKIDYRTSYVAVYRTDSKKLIERDEASNRELIYDCHIITSNSNFIVSPDLQQIVSYFSVTLSSKAWEWNKTTGEFKCWSRILINNVDYSRNKVGLNVVVFSMDKQCVMDSFNVNLHSDKNLRLIR